VGDSLDRYRVEDVNMRVWPCLIVVGTLAGCTGNTIDAGTNDAGSVGPTVNEGPTIIASGIQTMPTTLAADGTSVFWIDGLGGILSVPAEGGPVATVVPGMIENGFLAVDDANVYYGGPSGGLYRAPKGGGGAPSLVSEAGAAIRGATVLGDRAYWVDGPATGVIELGTPVTVKSAPLLGGAVSVVAQFNAGGSMGGGLSIGVTSSTVFLSGTGLSSFPLSTGVPDGAMPGGGLGVTPACEVMVSDTDAVYCDNGSIVRIASDGSTTALGPVLGLMGRDIALDDTSVYWVDAVTVGTIMRAPKTGGSARIIARDTVPVAIAVDANAVYWNDQGGNIMRLAK
jgi:hypothetical protein